jgi:serine/threonine protein kinase
MVRHGVRVATREECAVKLIRKQGLNNDAKQKLANELRAWRTLAHPNITRLYEVHETPLAYAFVSELCDGGDLLDRINEHGRYTEEDARPLMRQLASAVQFCHKRGIVHRDLKVRQKHFFLLFFLLFCCFDFSDAHSVA